jgi:protein TonB
MRRGAFAVAVHARRHAARPRVARPVPVPPSSSATIGINDVVVGLRPQRALKLAAASAALALLLHVGVGAWSASIRPRTKAKTTTTSLAVADTTAPLAEDLPPPPPQKAPPPPPSSNAPPPSSTAPVSSTSAAAPALAGLDPSSFSGSGGGAGGPRVGVGSPFAQPQSSSTSASTTTDPGPPLVAARPTTRTPPRYPTAARAAGTTGVVVVQIHIDDTGAVDDVRVVESTPPGVFNAAAIESVRSWHFEPATSGGQPMASWVRQTIRFTLEQT